MRESLQLRATAVHGQLPTTTSTADSAGRFVKTSHGWSLIFIDLQQVRLEPFGGKCRGREQVSANQHHSSSGNEGLSDLLYQSQVDPGKAGQRARATVSATQREWCSPPEGVSTRVAD